MKFHRQTCWAQWNLHLLILSPTPPGPNENSSPEGSELSGNFEKKKVLLQSYNQVTIIPQKKVLVLIPFCGNTQKKVTWGFTKLVEKLKSSNEAYAMMRYAMMFFHVFPSYPKCFPSLKLPFRPLRHSGTPDPLSLGPAQGLELPGFQFWPFLAISNCVKATQGVDGFFQGLLGLSLVIMKRMIIPFPHYNWYQLILMIINDY